MKKKVGLSKSEFLKRWDRDCVEMILLQDILARQRLIPEIQTKLKEQVYVHPFLQPIIED